MVREKAVVVGTTSWGTTLALILARRGMKVHLLARTEDEANKLNSKRENSSLLPGIKLPIRIQATASREEAFSEANVAVLAIPAQTMRKNVQWIKDYLSSSLIIISAAKGIEINTGKRMSQVIAEEISPALSNRVCVLSGPNIAKEIARGLHAVTVIAAQDNSIMKNAQRMVTAPHFYVFTNSDVIGVELGGALKNIIALGVGIIEGMGYGDNIKAACITRGITEITSLGIALGANPLTFSGLSGLGDIIVTCSSTLSRNHYVGVELGHGRPLQEITSSIPYVVEGISTTKAAYNLSRQVGVEMPITSLMYRVLFDNLSIREASKELLEYPYRYEVGIGDHI